MLLHILRRGHGSKLLKHATEIIDIIKPDDKGNISNGILLVMEIDLRRFYAFVINEVDDALPGLLLELSG